MKLKRVITAGAIIGAVALSAPGVSAEHYWNEGLGFEAARGGVSIDGVISAGEWDDAKTISVKLNGDPLDASGSINYQGEWDGKRSDSDYSGVYKIKWDENYLYFLEDRTDDHVNLSGGASAPWETDGGLIFTQIDNADSTINPEGINIQPFYTVGKDGKIGGELKARVCNMDEGSREVVDITGGKIVSALKAGGVITEIAVPWSFYSEYTPKFKAPAAGDKIGFSLVIHDSDSDTTGYVKQLCYAIDNDLTGDVPGGYDFGGWGVITLAAAAVTTPTAELPAATLEAPATAPAAPVTTAPQTADGLAIALLIAALAICTVKIVKRVKIK